MDTGTDIFLPAIYMRSHYSLPPRDFDPNYITCVSPYLYFLLVLFCTAVTSYVLTMLYCYDVTLS